MFMLYCYLTLMLCVALSLQTIPFFKKHIDKKSYLLSMLFICIFSLFLYQFSGDKLALASWINKDKQRYELLEKFDALGGVDGAIAIINKRLAINPNDAKGWLILGRLYQAKQDTQKANEAFEKAANLSIANQSRDR